MAEVKMPHTGHDQHLCLLNNVGADWEQYKKLVKNSSYVCKNCGRTAASDKNLCAPEKL
jgi:hypothetical protein